MKLTEEVTQLALHPAIAEHNKAWLKNTESYTPKLIVPLRYDTIRIMKQSQNRLAIIKCLSEQNDDCGGAPPFSASSIHHMLEYNFEWYGASKPTSISQIHRTLRDLHTAGIIVFETRIDDDCNNGLPQRVKYWQLADAVDRNKLIDEVNTTCKLAGKSHGVLLFGALFEQPFDAKEKLEVAQNIKVLMQRTHPDKVSGYEEQFKQLQESLNYVRSKINLFDTANIFVRDRGLKGESDYP